MAGKISMKTPLVELDGDEMTRVLWAILKDKLLKPYVDLKVEYYDLSIENRDKTNDKVTYESAEAIKKYGVGVKCATITANQARVEEYNLKTLLPSPNATVRAILDGTVFRKPIMVKNIKPAISTWTKPITIGRHAYGDVYKNAEIAIPGAGKAELVFTGKDGKELRKTIHEFEGPGIIQGMHNVDKSIESFAHSCFIYALSEKVNVWFGTKDTISKTYDGRFKEIFNRVFKAEYEAKFKAAGIEYWYFLIDDAVAQVVKSKGGFLWACKNYDGDVMSDMVASTFGSLAMMTSVLVSPDGYFEYEAAHGTVQKHYYKWKAGEKTSTNPIALIFAWTGALRKRGELDKLPDLVKFADNLETASLGAIQDGEMTGDLSAIAEPRPAGHLNSDEFIEAIAKRLAKLQG